MNKQNRNTEAIMKQFNDAFQTHEPSMLTCIIGASCVMESIQGPDGILYEGFEACMTFWSELATDPNTQFDVEEVFVAGDRATIRWRYRWGPAKENSVRGVNLMLVRDGKIVEALGYSKTLGTGLDN